jgi:hypothetical protein
MPISTPWMSERGSRASEDGQSDGQDPGNRGSGAPFHNGTCFPFQGRARERNIDAGAFRQDLGPAGRSPPRLRGSNLFEIPARSGKLLRSSRRAIVDPLNVSQFLAAYNASLADVLELKVSTITGILEPKNNTIYRGEVYWFLVDGAARLTVRIPERYRDLSGRRVEVTGQPSRRTNEDRGEIEVILRVQKITPLDPVPEDWIGPLLPIGEKRRSSWPAIERSIESRILAGDQPRVLMFYGASSIVDKDVRRALGQHVQAGVCSGYG